MNESVPVALPIIEQDLLQAGVEPPPCCGNCRFGFRDGQNYRCRRLPPTHLMIPLMGEPRLRGFNGQPPQPAGMIEQSNHVLTGPQNWCGEHKFLVAVNG